MSHSRSQAAEHILDKEFSVLDKGFLRLVDYLGSDDRIVQSARVSYGEGTKTFRQNSALIDYLMRNEHSSPFEQVVLVFHAKMPIFVARQWVRHRTARINEISGRYSVMPNEFYVPKDQNIAFQSQDNKQGRTDFAVSPHIQTQIQNDLKNQQSEAYKAYSKLLEQGLARELARINLPLSLYTEWFWQIDLHNLFHFLRLRLNLHAQYEIRVYAEVMLDIAKAVAPLATASFQDHHLNTVRFSLKELKSLRQLLGIRELDSKPTIEDNYMNRFSERIQGIMEKLEITDRERERLALKLLKERQI